MSLPHEQRISLVERNPNPLFVYWLEQWLSFAKQKKSRNETALATALKSMRLYPLVLHSGRECSILNGCVTTICQMLDKQLAVYRAQQQTTADRGALPTQADLDRSQREVLEKVRVEVVRRAQADRDVMEARRNVGVITLDPPPFDSGPKQGQKRAKKASTAVASTSTAVPAKKPSNVLDLFQKYDQQSSAANPPEVETVVSSQLPEPADAIILKSGTYDIILLVDTAETAGAKKRSVDATILELEKNKVRFEVRRLSVGDFLWIGRRKDSAQQPAEVVLPHIVERKRMDDLGKSIKDGRYNEQKFRLRHSGIANIVYMVESCGAIGNARAGLPLQTLYQAATNTQVQNDFVVRFTESHADSMRYLAVMTELLVEMYTDKDLIVAKTTQKTQAHATVAPVAVLDFKAFADGTMKIRNFRVRDMFVRQLLGLRGLSVDKAIAIVQRYPTPSRLLRAYAECGDVRTAELLLANVQFGEPPKAIGPKISKTLYSFYHERSSS